MNINELLSDKTIKPKEKTEAISRQLLDKTLSINDLIAFAQTAKEAAKATCIEALEYATQTNPTIATRQCWDFVSKTLAEKPPRIKWESARVIANTAHLFANNLNEAISQLLKNTEHEGTVVRWSAALALGEIIKLNTLHNKELISAAEAIMLREEKNSIKKIYQIALKKVLKK